MHSCNHHDALHTSLMHMITCQVYQACVRLTRRLAQSREGHAEVRAQGGAPAATLPRIQTHIALHVGARQHRVRLASAHEWTACAV